MEEGSATTQSEWKCLIELEMLGSITISQSCLFSKGLGATSTDPDIVMKMGISTGVNHPESHLIRENFR